MEAFRRFVIRVAALASKETTHIRRDPRTLYLALGMPLVMLVLFGYGVSFDIDHIPLAIADLDRTDESRLLADAFTASEEFDAKLRDGAEAAANVDAILRRGGAAAVLVIPEDYTEKLAAGETAEVQLVLDGSDAMSTMQSLAKADTLALAAAARAVGGSGSLRGAPPIEVRAITRYNPEGRSALYIIPGLTAYILALVAVLLTALTVSREWERGSMEQLFATPVGRFEIILGKLLPYLALGALQTLLVLAAGATIFDVPVRGSLPVLALASLLFMLGMLGQGLLISVVAKNQMIATQAGTMSSVLPSMLLSGFLFPIENMPKALQYITMAIPARYFVEALRGVLLRGNGLAEQYDQLLALAAFAALTLLLSTARFTRRLA